ncbi:MAG: molybdopterin molybdenumtransferase MoeA, partial [Desulfobacterales bacterium]
MLEFFNVTDLASVLKNAEAFTPVGTETVPLPESCGRVLADTLSADRDLPEFSRATMDGYAVKASDTFGASDGSPAYLTVKGTVSMGQT